jgi:hypothetical protein
MLIPKITYTGNTVNTLVTPNIVAISMKDDSAVSDAEILSYT